MSVKYWAGESSDKIVDELRERVARFNRYIQRRGLSKKWERSENLYFGRHTQTTSVNQGSIEDVGDEGEQKAVTVNHFRNLIKHVLALTTSQKPSFDPIAINSDLKSQQQTRLANSILDAYLVEKRMGRYMSGAAERSLVYDKSYVNMGWDTSLGRAYSTEVQLDDNGQIVLDENGEPREKVVYEGDAKIQSKTPWDVIYDPDLRDFGARKWEIVRDFPNKWDVAHRYPKHFDYIASYDGADSYNDMDLSQYSRNNSFDRHESDTESDIIPVYTFSHLRTDALPSGRYIVFVGDRLCYDGPYPYGDTLPTFRITPGEEFDTAEGYTDANDIMALQEAVSFLASTAFSNLQAFAGQMIHLPTGCEVSTTQIGPYTFLKGGMPGTEPKPLSLAAIPAELAGVKKDFEGTMEKLVGVNSVVRGDPDSNLKSGVALGRVQAMAIQYMSNFQKSWGELQEDCGTFLLDLLKRFAKTERMIALAGKTNRRAMQSFVGNDIGNVDRVKVNLGNPVTSTGAGRAELAENFLQKGGISFDEYLQILETGQIQSVLESRKSHFELIQKENEMLMEGGLPQASIIDKHSVHVPEHRSVIDDPYLRDAAAKGDKDAQAILQNTLTHIQEHINLSMQLPPQLAMMMGEPPPPPPPMPPGGPGMAPPPGAGPMPPPGPEMAGPPPVPSGPDMVAPPPPVNGLQV